MIKNWHYDDGKPIYSETIKQYLGKEMPPSWRCTFRDGDISEWVENQGYVEDVDYDLIFRFNSGDPRYFLTIFNEQLAAAFALRWT